MKTKIYKQIYSLTFNKMSSNTIKILHGVAATVHLATAAAMTALVVNDPGIKWPIISRGWQNEGSTYKYNLGYLLPVFPFLSSINHIVSLADREWYDNVLKKGLNTVRWFEYSISAGVMIVLIGELSGVLEIRSLVVLAMLNALLQYHGYLIEKAVADNAPKSTIIELLTAAFAIHVTMWTMIFVSFFSVIGNRKTPVPAAVNTIVIILFTLFTSFGILSSLWALGKIKSFNIVEMGYIILSLTSKLFLSWFLYFGVLKGDNRNL
jgi:hypothetical protein